MSIEKVLNKINFFRQMLKFRKITNLALKEAQMALGHTKLHYYPNTLSIDIGNVCNLRCPLCPTGRGDDGAAKGFMAIEDYKRIIDELGPYLTKLDLHNWGEPLLNKDLIPMIRYAKARDIPVHISTNLMKLDEEMAEALIDTRLEKIFISCDGASPETYSIYRVGGDFDKLINNIRLLIAAKKKLRNRTTRLRLLFHVFRHNEHEIEKITRLARDLGVELVIDRMRPDMGKEIFEDAREAIERDSQWIPTDPRYCPFDMEKKEKKAFRPCRELWKTAVVNWEGSILPCCAVYGERYRFGNIFEEPFFVIWNNDKYIAARKEVRGEIDLSPTICHTCRMHGHLHF